MKLGNLGIHKDLHNRQIWQLHSHILIGPNTIFCLILNI